MAFSAGFAGHEEGHVAVCYGEDGVRVITGGSEGDIKIYKSTKHTDEPESTFFADAFNIGCISQWDDTLVASSEGWSLQRWGFPDGNKTGFLGKFAGNVTHFSLNFARDMILVGSAEFTMKISGLESDEQYTIRGHEAPILRTAFGRRYFASSSCDGTLRVWDAKTRECLKTLNIYPKSNDVDLSKVRGAILFDEKENLVVAGENEVVIYSCGTWTELQTLKSEAMSSILELELSHCARFVVVGCKDGSVFVWDLSTRTLINKMRCVSVPSSISTHPTEYKMLLGDTKGMWRECNPYLTPDMIPDMQTTAQIAPKEPNGFFDLESEDLGDLDDWGEDDTLDIANIDREEDDIKPAAPRRSAVFGDEDDDSNEPSILQMGKLPQPRSTTSELLLPPKPLTPEPVYTGPELQEAFQVSSSPEHLQFRYLVWNDVGIITSRDEEDASYLNIEFHDTTTHHPLHMANTQGFTMGSLSKAAYALATPGSEESAKSSSLQVHVFSSWSTNKEWNVTLPGEERAILLSVSASLIALVTDTNYLRTWSLGGLQKHLICITGDPVTLASHNNLLLAAHYAGTTLSLSLFDTSKPRLLHSGPLPVSPGSSLAWAGFTEGALPVMYDSEGVLRALLPQAGLLWVPLTDLKVGKRNISDTYWITGVTDESVKCILCKGVPYPGLSPRPLLALLPHSLPLCDAGSERSALEQNRVINFVSTYRLSRLNTFEKECKAETLEKEEVTLLLKLMALAIKNNRDYKALELARMMPTKQSLEMSARYANKTGRVLLAQKINQILRNYEDAPEEEDDIFEIGEVSYNPEPFLATTAPTTTNHASSSIGSGVSLAKKRVSHIDESVAPMRLHPRPKKPDTPTPPEDPTPIDYSPEEVPEANPFSVKSSGIQNTQRRSTSFLETIESKSLEVEQKRRSVQKVLEKPAGLTLADLGKKSCFTKITKITATKPSGGAKRGRPKAPGGGKDKPKKKTGYSLWFASLGEGVEAKSGPLKWRHLPASEKEKWLEEAKCADTEPSVESAPQVDSPVVVPEIELTADEGPIHSEKENDRPGKRRADSESEGESTDSAKPPKSKKLDSTLVSKDTQSKLAAFQFKKK